MGHAPVVSNATAQVLKGVKRVAAPEERGKWEKVLEQTEMALDMMPMGFAVGGAGKAASNPRMLAYVKGIIDDLPVNKIQGTLNRMGVGDKFLEKLSSYYASWGRETFGSEKLLDAITGSEANFEGLSTTAPKMLDYLRRMDAISAARRGVLEIGKPSVSGASSMYYLQNEIIKKARGGRW